MKLVRVQQTFNQNEQNFCADRKRLKSRNKYNSPEFYAQHPDLAPRNIYLRLGRVIDMDEVNRVIEDFAAPWYIKMYNSVKRFLKKK